MAEGRKKSGTEVRKRGRVIGFRASDSERALIEAAAQRAGLTSGSYIRSRALEKPTTRAVRRAPVETAQLAQLLGMLGQAGGALQLLLRREPSASETSEALTLFREAASAILTSLGRRAHDH